MIQYHIFGRPFETDAVTADLPVSEDPISYGDISTDGGFSWHLTLAPDDRVYGLGESLRGINKRGWIYISYAADEPHHLETNRSLYSAHNFILISGHDRRFGIFFDYPGSMTFDIGYTDIDEMTVSCESADLKIYVIDGENEPDIVREFRSIIGRSYIPPKFAFGYGQSRWGYKTPEDFREVADRHRSAHVPLDMIYMDIDYMDHYKDFTVNRENFPDSKAFVGKMKEDHIRLVPIIDAGVRIEKGYDVYEEGKEKGYFVKKADGKEFEACVWPGMTHFPDVLNPEARAWFGSQYKKLTDMGIEAFWNDMCEPAIFYTDRGKAGVEQAMRDHLEGRLPEEDFQKLGGLFGEIANNDEDYRSFFHNVSGQLVRHDRVHNLFGYNMSRSAAEALEKISPDKRIMMFSRSSYIGAHRYAGLWTGDNNSWWSHMHLILHQLPGLSMCGFLYSGPDCGGFNEDTTEDLVLRWSALSVFTPLFRNHSAMGTRRQEFFRFRHQDAFKAILEARYRLIPYLYSEYMKAALKNDMLFKPLAFVYPDDKVAVETEDQLMLGNEIMIAPVCTQNAAGRTVYLPEEMKFIRFRPEGQISEEILPAGLHYVEVALNEVPLFIRYGAAIPVADAAEYVEAIDYHTIRMIGYDGAPYELYNDDGISRI